MRKGRSWQTFGKKISKLIARVNLQQTDAARVHMFPEPVVLDGVMLGAGSHALGFQAGKGESTYIVFMDLDMHVCYSGHLKTNGGAEFPDQVHNGKEVLAGGAQSNIFGLHGRKGDFSLQLGLP